MYFQLGAKGNVKKLILSSFGFKYGVPQDAGYVFDVRFIPNPFYVADLRPLSGMDEPVRKYVKSFAEADAFLASCILFLDFVIPRCLEAERETLHVAVGCTGGRHRSVVFTAWLCEHYGSPSTDIGVDFTVELRHRDVDKTSEP